VWLGEADLGSNFAMDFIPKLLDQEFLKADNWSHNYGFVALGELMGLDWFCCELAIDDVEYANEVITTLSGMYHSAWKIQGF
jgi:hypothetical protein